MDKIVCYTCITGGYDVIKEASIKPSNIDFICFTDANVKTNTWKIRPIPEDLSYLSDVKKQRIVKICPHRYLSNYDISIWIDGNISIVGDLNRFVEQYNLDDSPLYSRIHPCRNCIYQEAKACIDLGKDDEGNIRRQIQKYKDESYPENIGMVETCILLRKHNDVKCVLIDNAWATELLQQSHRDQLSFNYICWKHNFLPGSLTKEFEMNSNNYFRITPHAR